LGEDIYLYIIIHNVISVMQSWIFSIITPFFSVTWSFRKHSDMICSSKWMSYYQ